MATLKCLACGHDNKVGDESCSSCSSSLNLKLCSVCEAINAHSAERCHGCKADFRVEAEVVAPAEAETSPRRGEVHEAPFIHRTLPTAWRAAAQAARKRSTRLTVGLWLVPLLALGLGYYSYAGLRKSEAVPTPQGANAEAQPVVSGKLAPPKTAPAPLAKTAPAPIAKIAPVEPKPATAVTHTRTGAAAPAAAPTVARAAPVSAVNAAVAAPSEPPAPNPARRHVPVTHTKAVLTEAAVPATAAASAAEGRSAPAETRSDEPAECAPAVVALGLCKSK